MKVRRNAFRPTCFIAWLSSILLALVLTSLSSAAPASLQAPTRAIPWSPATPVDNFPRIGVESFFSTQYALHDIVGAGARYARVEVAWSQVEPTNTTPPNYNWYVFDPLFSNAASAGITLLVTIVGCPDWACPRDIGPLNDGMYGEAAQFMGAMSTHYSADPYRVHYWELWNEPDGADGPTPGDHSWGWGAFPDKYVLMLQSVYPAIKIADPQSVVVTGGIAYANFWSEGGPFNPDFLPGVIADGGRPYFDAIAYHYYNNDSRYTNVGTKAVAIRSAIGPAAQGIPFLCTEAGLTSDPLFGSSEAIQARYIVKLYSWAASNDVRSVSWYLYRDYASPDPQHDIFAKAGLVRLDNSHKPSYNALQVYAQEVGSSPYLGPLGPADGLPAELEGYKFRTPPGNNPSLNTWIVWSRTGATATLTIPAIQAPAVVRAKGLEGEPVAIAPGSTGALLVSVGADPVYVEMNSDPPRFSDVPYIYWAYDYVEYLASNGIVGGYADGTFRPGSSATRGQFAKMDTLGMAWTLLNPPEPTFSDVMTGSTFYRYVETAYAQGVISGYPCGGPDEPCDPQSRPYFRANNNITRAQIAKIIVRSKNWSLLNPTQPTFHDIPYASTFYQYVETAVSKGILSGYQCGSPNEPCDDQSRPYFRPGNNATRAQLSKMLSLALQQP